MTALPTVELDPPTISMTFGVNDSPLAGRDGTHVSGNIWIIDLYLFWCNVLCHILIFLFLSNAFWCISTFLYFNCSLVLVLKEMNADCSTILITTFWYIT